MTGAGNNMNFEFLTPTRIIFGSHSFENIAEHISSLGKRAFIITDPSGRYLDVVKKNLQSKYIPNEYFMVQGEPKIEDIIKGVQISRDFECDVIVAIGGGSIIDSGKAIAIFTTNSGEITDYLEVIGKGNPITKPPIPFIAVPTTAGTGSEVTSNAVLSSSKDKVKVSARSPLMFPRIALIDPLLTVSTTPLVTASSGLDALIQLIEAYVSNKSNPMTDSICMEGIKRASASLKAAYQNANDIKARENMSIAAMFSGIALSNAKLGAIHGIAGPLGGMIDIPHGIACANLFLPTFSTNIDALTSREPKNPAIDRLVEIIDILSGKNKTGNGVKVKVEAEVKVENSVRELEMFLNSFDIPSLSEFGLTENMIPELVIKSKNSSSMKGNPVSLTEDEIQQIIMKAL
jgi:alcohol dehydrogenase class IV